MDKSRWADALFYSGWTLFFAGIPFIGWSSLGLLLLFMEWAAGYRRRRKPELDPPPLYQAAVWGLIAAFFLSSVFAASRYDAFGTSVGYALAHLFGLSYAYRVERERPGAFLRSLWIAPLAGAAHAALGLYQIATGARRAVGVHENPNAFGTAMLFALFLGILALASAKGRVRWLVWPYTVLVCGGLLASGSRGSWLGAAAGVVVFAVLYAVMHREGLRRRAVKVAAVVVMATLAVGLAVAAWGNDYLQRRFDSMFTLDRNQDRVVLYRTVWNMFKAYPLLGVGPNNIKHHYDDFVVVQGRYQHHGMAHNLFLQALSETGVIGTAFLVLLLGCWFVLGFPRAGSPAHLGLYALLAALVVRDQFDGASVNLNILFFMTWLGATLIAYGWRGAQAKES